MKEVLIPETKITVSGIDWYEQEDDFPLFMYTSDRMACVMPEYSRPYRGKRRIICWKLAIYRFDAYRYKLSRLTRNSAMNAYSKISRGENP